jgi:hypothetical protein
MSQPLPDIFHTLVSSAIDEQGVHPHQMVTLFDGRCDVFALATTPAQVFQVVRVKLMTADELVFGLDRYSLGPAQGTKYRDLVGCGWWRRGLGWCAGIIEYQHEPRDVLALDWSNSYWTPILLRELRRCFPVGFAKAEPVADGIGEPRGRA